MAIPPFPGMSPDLPLDKMGLSGHDVGSGKVKKAG